jgi:hypothetical protein
MLRVAKAKSPAKIFRLHEDGTVEKISHDAGFEFQARRVPFDGFTSMAKALTWLETQHAILIRGEPVNSASFDSVEPVLRRMNDAPHPATGEMVRADFREAARRWLMIDTDKLPCPVGINPAEDPEAAIDFLVQHLPAELLRGSFYWQFSSSQNVPGHVQPGEPLPAPKTISAHLVFLSDVPRTSEELKRWAKVVNAAAGHKLIDPALFSAVQPHFIAPPSFEGDWSDPLPVRSGVRRGETNTVSLPIPLEPVAIAGTRAISDGTGLEGGRGYEGYKALLGDGPDLEGFHGPLKAAIGAYVAAHGVAGTDPEALRAHLEAAILAAPRGPQRSADSIKDHIRNLPKMVRWTLDKQAKAEEAAEPLECEVPEGYPTLSADEASAQFAAALEKSFAELPGLTAARRRFEAAFPSYEATVNEWKSLNFFAEPPEADLNGSTFIELPPAPKPLVFPEMWARAAFVSTGVGKTHAVIEQITKALKADPEFRACFVVPEHALGHGIVKRINDEAGEEVAQEWRGLSQPNLNRPGEAMCPMHESVAELQAAGGHQGAMCGSVFRKFCPHHPKVARDAGCGYRIQQKAGVRVWVIPAAMLTRKPPKRLERPALMVDGVAVRQSPFDLIVIDESPWLGFLGGFEGRGYGVELDSLRPANWDIPDQGDVPGAATQKVRKALGALRTILDGLPLGPLPLWSLLSLRASQRRPARNCGSSFGGRTPIRTSWYIPA